MFKIKKPSVFKDVEHRFNSHTLNEILPYLPNEDCFFDTRHWTCDTTDGLLPFAVTTDISRNAQQYLKIMKEVLPLNADEEGLCRPLKAQYYKNGRANFLKDDGGSFAATGVIERNTPMKGNYTEPRICTMVGRDPENPSSRVRSDRYEQMIEMGDDVSNTLTSVQKDNLVAEPQILTPKRTDFGKQVRKQYEAGELDMSRHDMTELEPRKDGISNTLTSVQKDNLVAEPLQIKQATKQGYIEIPPGSVFDASYPDSQTRRGRVQDGGQTSPTLMASGEAPCYYEGVEPKVINPLKGKSEYGWHYEQAVYDQAGITRAVKSGEGSGNIPKVIENQMNYRIRKLTPRECFRLMGVSESNIDKIQESGVSQTQQYKMAGNSIVVDCLFHLFRKMFTETDNESNTLTLF